MSHESDNKTAVVLEIQRLSTEDGPGIRTSVFFKGCSLKCLWCHNPESIVKKPQLHWVGTGCIACQICIETCPNNNLTMTDQGVSIDRQSCLGCGQCAEQCPSTALAIMGRTWSLPDLVAEVIKDRAYFETSSGGITVSGGEPALHADFVADFLNSLQNLDLHTALDTCGQCSASALEKMVPHTDLVLFDLKAADPEKHKELTGHSNEKILTNLSLVSNLLQERTSPGDLWIRTPIIPGATADKDNLLGLGRLIAEKTNGAVSRWELLSFNNLCQDKYTRLGLNWIYTNGALITGEQMEQLTETARCSGVDPAIVCWTGSTKIEDDKSPKEKGPQLRTVKSSACC